MAFRLEHLVGGVDGDEQIVAGAAEGDVGRVEPDQLDLVDVAAETLLTDGVVAGAGA
jgi:hypothetical protein